MQTGTSRRASLALCAAAVAASVCAFTPVSSRACTADFGATGSAAAACPTTGGSMCLCGKGAKTAALSAAAPANLVLASDLSAGAAGPRVAAVSPAATVPVGMAFVPAVFNYSFLPPDVTINAGDTVLWTNTDTTFHTTTSTGSESWDSSFLAPGASFAHTFNSVGDFTYECTLHFGMTGVIHVAAVVPEPAGAVAALGGLALAMLRRRKTA